MSFTIVFLTFVSSLTVGFFGRFFGFYGSALLSTSCLILAFFCSVFIFYDVAFLGCFSYVKLVSWVSSGTLSVDWSFMFAFFCFLFFFFTFVFYFPNTLNHPDNCIPADPMETPAHVVPEWYFLPFYATLRSIPNKAGGIVTMGGAIAVLFLIPFNNTSDIRNTTYRPIFRVCYWVLIASWVVLTWIGQCPVEDIFAFVGQMATVYYYVFFILLVPVVGQIESALAHYPANFLEKITSQKRLEFSALASTLQEATKELAGQDPAVAVVCFLGIAVVCAFSALFVRSRGANDQGQGEEYISSGEGEAVGEDDSDSESESVGEDDLYMPQVDSDTLPQYERLLSLTYPAQEAEVMGIVQKFSALPPAPRGVNLQGLARYLSIWEEETDGNSASNINGTEPAEHFQESSLELVDIGEISAAFRIFQLSLKLAHPRNRFCLSVLTAKFIKFHVPTLIGVSNYEQLHIIDRLTRTGPPEEGSITKYIGPEEMPTFVGWANGAWTAGVDYSPEKTDFSRVYSYLEDPLYSAYGSSQGTETVRRRLLEIEEGRRPAHRGFEELLPEAFGDNMPQEYSDAATHVDGLLGNL